MIMKSKSHTLKNKYRQTKTLKKFGLKLKRSLKEIEIEEKWINERTNQLNWRNSSNILAYEKDTPLHPHKKKPIQSF